MKKLGFMLFLAVHSGYTSADIYKHISRDGKVYYTDKPKKWAGYKRIIKSKLKKSVKNPYKNITRNKRKYSTLIAQAAAKYKVDERLLHAIIRTESAYNVKAISSAGAVGLMQLMPKTAAQYGVKDRTNAKQNIDGGTQYLKYLLNRFGSNVDLAIASYNAGEGAIAKYNNSIPPYPETIKYVRNVLKRYKSS